MNIPIISFEIVGMRHTLKVALSEHAALMDADMQRAIDDFCQPANIAAVIRKVSHQALEQAIQQEVDSFFRYGEGRKVVAEAVKTRLLEKKTFGPLDDV